MYICANIYVPSSVHRYIYEHLSLNRKMCNSSFALDLYFSLLYFLFEVTAFLLQIRGAVYTYSTSQRLLNTQCELVVSRLFFMSATHRFDSYRAACW